MKEKLNKIKNTLKTKKSTQKKKVEKKCMCKYRKYIYTFSVLLIVYFLLVIFAKNINSFLIYPEVFLESNNKLEVNYIDGKQEKLVFYFAGKAPLEDISYFKNLGYKVAIFDYTKNIKTNYEIRDEEINSEAEKFFELILEQKDIKRENAIVLGKGKGSFFASNFALRNNIDKLVLISPVSSFYDLSRDNIGFAFQKPLFLQDLSVKKNLKNYYNKLLVLSSNKDNYFMQSKELFRSAKGDNYFLELDDIDTKNTFNSYSVAVNEIIKNFLNDTGRNSRYNFIDELELQAMLQEIEYNRIFDSVDLLTDSSLTKFVNNKVPFNDVSYIPEDLVPVGAKHIIDSKGGIMKTTRILKENLEKMANAFYEETKNNIVVVSGYRSYLYQKGIKDRGCPDNLCAKPGYSEHQSGLAIDLYSASSNRNWANDNTLQKYYKWLSNNAHKYGFTNTYQKGLEVDGYEIEPWHWRYVGEELATLLKDNKLTLAEFYDKKMVSIN